MITRQGPGTDGDESAGAALIPLRPAPGCSPEALRRIARCLAGNHPGTDPPCRPGIPVAGMADSKVGTMRGLHVGTSFIPPAWSKGTEDPLSAAVTAAERALSDVPDPLRGQVGAALDLLRQALEERHRTWMIRRNEPGEQGA